VLAITYLATSISGLINARSLARRGKSGKNATLDSSSSVYGWPPFTIPWYQPASQLQKRSSRLLGSWNHGSFRKTSIDRQPASRIRACAARNGPITCLAAPMNVIRPHRGFSSFIIDTGRASHIKISESSV